MRLEVASGTAFAWLSERTGVALTHRARGLAAVDAYGQIRGAVAYDQWAPNSCEAHMAVDTPIAWRTLLPHVFVYPFSHVGIIFGLIREGNARSVEMARHLGFRVTKQIHDGWADGENLLLMELRRENCRFLKPNVTIDPLHAPSKPKPEPLQPGATHG